MDREKKWGIGALAMVAMGSLMASQSLNFFVFRSIPESQSWKLNTWFFMTHIRNHGGVFGIFQGKAWLFTAVSAMLLVFLIVFLIKSEQVKRFEFICFGFILGGGFSNILDRFIYGSVIDYFDIRGIPHWHYIFNLADVMIHVGLWSMILIGLFHSRLRGKK